MFLCVSPNPAIDKRLTLESLRRGEVNRAVTATGYAGGKAAHVAMVLRTLGQKPSWIGPCGGASGAEVVSGLLSMGIQATGFPANQTTRTNLEIIEANGTVTEVLEPGAAPSMAEWGGFTEACKDLFAKGREKLSVIFSGSLPSGTDPGFYAKLISLAHQAKVRTFLDTSGEALRAGVRARPAFVKPNREEISRLLNLEVSSLPAAAKALRKVLELGPESAALSLGSEGLMYCAAPNELVLFAPSLPIKVRSAVGCGDSALAGFALGIATKLSAKETLRLAAACASANCMADSPGAARLSDIRKFQEQISVQEIV